MELTALNLPKAKINQLEKKGIETVEELAGFFPRKYQDYRCPKKVRELETGQEQAVVGRITASSIGNKGVVRMSLMDEEGQEMNLVFFNQTYLANKFVSGDRVIACGKPEWDTWSRKMQMNSPFISKDIKGNMRIIPVYSKVQRMSDEYLRNSIEAALNAVDVTERIEWGVKVKFDLMEKRKAYRALHAPKDFTELEKAKRTILFEDLFLYAIRLEEEDRKLPRESSLIPTNWSAYAKILDRLPFNLTDGQTEVLDNLRMKMEIGERVDALVQGDVGCGKTIVAILMMSYLVGSGYQAAIMAPTNVLAKQHYEEVKRLFAGTGVSASFLSGEMKAAARKKEQKKIASGETHIVVGTHAVISKEVQFKNLAITIVDEEHRFGVKQRETLREKAKAGVHHIGMSATPIPRSLALAVHGGGTDIHSIRTLPNGRRPVKTVWFHKEERAWNGIVGQVKEGRQAYVICPLIDESDSESLQGVKSAEETYAELKNLARQHPELRIEMITGKMKAAEVEAAIERFSRNETNVLVSTTIVEVGVNVPNATMMVLRNAERFGLAQLHQLRGRVGRGKHQSYCVLISEAANQKKLEIMTQTTDGFVIAEADVKLRGAGDFVSTEQSGQNKYVRLIMENNNLYRTIREEVTEVFNDPKRLHYYRTQQVLAFEEDAS